MQKLKSYAKTQIDRLYPDVTLIRLYRRDDALAANRHTNTRDSNTRDYSILAVRSRLNLQ
jgi:hypothetical protein